MLKLMLGITAGMALCAPEAGAITVTSANSPLALQVAQQNEPDKNLFIVAWCNASPGMKELTGYTGKASDSLDIASAQSGGGSMNVTDRVPMDGVADRRS
jgi:hypothetical protein